jgi:ATP-dependent DNA ligase
MIYSRNGHDFTERFPSIAQLLHELPAKAAVLDGPRNERCASRLPFS